MWVSLRLLLFAWLVSWLAACAPSPSVPLPSPTAARPAPTAVHTTKAAATKASAQATAPANVQGVQVNVTLADHGISSSLTAFKIGVPYTFVIRNTGTRGICFNIAPPVSVTGSMGASQGAALVSIPESRLGLGATFTATYTFPTSAAGTALEFSCLQRREYDDKVRLAITVTQ